MVLVQDITYTALMGEQSYITQAGEWAGYETTDTANLMRADMIFTGYSLNWNGFIDQPVLGSFNNLSYSGYTTNFGSQNKDGVLGAFVNSPYTGYTTNWGQYEQPITNSVYDIDKNSVVDHPKQKTIFYKLRGWNPIAQAHEVWVISHNITGRTSLDGALFDPAPGKQAADVERDLFKKPPSGNPLTDVIVLSRWEEDQ